MFCGISTGEFLLLCLRAVSSVVGRLDDAINVVDLLFRRLRSNGRGIREMISVLVSSSWEQALLKLHDLGSSRRGGATHDQDTIGSEKVGERICRSGFLR